jgi:hypothetical protein
MRIYIIILLAALVLGCCQFRKHSEYLDCVEDYANALLDKGRDTYGTENSPLIATTLIRETLKLPEGDSLEALLSLERESWGIRPHDRMLTGANPMHDQVLYQILYALTDLTGDLKYAEEADRTLKWFFENCQSEQTGLMAWGEHIGWDFNTETTIEKRQRYNHEFFRPWVFWEKCYELAPQNCIDFASGLWYHQIHDHETGEFSRHAQYDQHGTGIQNQYPRHGGFFIATWAEAYKQTKDTLYLRAIDVIYQFYHRNRNSISGAIPGEVDNPRSNNLLLWPQSILGLAIDLWDAAPGLPQELGSKLKEMALEIDGVYLRIKHDVSPDGAGFVSQGNAETLAAEDVRDGNNRVYSDRWTTGYGESTDANSANVCMLRYQQTGNKGFRQLVLATADRYLDTEPVSDFPVYPGSLGDVIHLLLNAHELTGDQMYLDRAHHFAGMALQMFFDDSSPLPKASSKHWHYEAITRADNLMMALLRLYLIANQMDIQSRLIYLER